MTTALKPSSDRLLRRALLGVQCVDAVDGRPVQDGLRVEFVDHARPRHREALNAGPSGVFVLHRHPGVQTLFANADDSEAAGSELSESPADEGRFEVRVTDPLQRYVDTRLSTRLPADELMTVPLYSAPTRTPPIALACLRAELRLRSQPEQAARWAWLRLTLGAQTLAEGPADAQGRALLVFPLPRPREGVLHGSPATAEALLDWSVVLHAHWHPDRLADDVADQNTLRQQPEVGLLQQRLPPVSLTPLSLRAGQPLLAHRPPSSFLFVAD